MALHRVTADWRAPMRERGGGQPNLLRSRESRYTGEGSFDHMLSVSAYLASTHVETGVRVRGGTPLARPSLDATFRLCAHEVCDQRWGAHSLGRGVSLVGVSQAEAGYSVTV